MCRSPCGGPKSRRHSSLQLLKRGGRKSWWSAVAAGVAEDIIVTHLYFVLVAN